MSRVFDGSSNWYLSRAAAIRTATPLTMVAWATQENSAVFANFPMILTLGTNGSANNRFTLSWSNTGNCQATARNTSSASATASVAVPDANWHHYAAVFTSATSRAAFFDGANKGTNATSQTPVAGGMNLTVVGINPLLTGSQHQGKIAHVAVYSDALSDDQIAMLGTYRLSPLAVRPDALIGYWPYFGRDSTEIDMMGANNLAVTGSTASADEPPLLWLPGRRRIFLPAGATTHSVSITETGSADDVLTGVMQTAVVLSESGSAADAHGAALTAVVALAESASGADVIAAIATRLGALTESGAATDQVDGSTGPATYNVAVLEAGSAADAVLAALTAAAAYDESGAASDAQSALLSMVGPVLESGAAADLLVAQWQTFESLTEVAAAIDQVICLDSAPRGGTRIVIVRTQIRAVAAAAENRVVTYAANRTVQLLH